MPEVITQGIPTANPEKLICIYGESGSGKTTEVIKYITESGKSAVYVDFDGNSAPIYNSPAEVLERINYIKVRNSLGKMHVADFINKAMEDPMINICLRHGYLGCGLCKRKQLDTLAVNFDDWENYDLAVIDSVTIMVNAIILFSIKESARGQDKSPHDVWARVSLMAKTMMHFLRECHPNVIVLSHPIDIRLPFQKVIQKRPSPRAGKELVDPYYSPVFGSVPFSRQAAKNLSAVIFQNTDGSIITQERKPYFANTRMPIKGNTVSEALHEILG